MIIKIEQTQSNLKNKFEIKTSEKAKYLAGTPWMDITKPLTIGKIGSCILTSTDESIYFATNYNIVENISNSIIPIKWAFTGEQKGTIYKILDDQNNICGKFYRLTNGILDTKYVIEYGKHTLKCYDRAIGKTRHISIYNEEFQIAEIVKPLCVINNLDNYYIFLLDEFNDLEAILSFFTIFFDYQNYSNNGEIVAHKSELEIHYTYDKNNKFYNKDWIPNHFNKNDIDSINNQILENRKETSSTIKKQTKHILTFIFLGWLIVLIIFAIFYYFSH